MLTTRLTHLPPNRAVLLRNETCVYCGCRIEPGADTKEHVIGRRFVPKGSLNGDWNLIVRACKPCNNRKSDLEDDVSAITMQPDATGLHATPEELLAIDAKRKAQNSRSRKTGKRVAESAETMSLKFPVGSHAELTFTMVSPPQLDSARVYELARLHMSAFFYFITYNHEARTGGFWPGEFCPVMRAPRSDWGNPVLKAFMNSVQSWEPRFLVTTAGGYFKAAVRRHPSAATWSWAVEWNQSYRVVGFLGEREPAAEVVKSFPALQAHTVMQGKDDWVRYRTESNLAEDEDFLFGCAETDGQA